MKKVLSLAIYLGGLGALLLSDLIITSRFESEEIALWAEIRSLVGISGVLCLVGLDQVLIRSRRSNGVLLKLIGIQAPLIALLVGFLIWEMGFLNSWTTATLIGVGAAGSGALFQYYRSNNMVVASQLSQQLWKIFTLVSVVAIAQLGIGIELDAVVAALFIMTVFIMASLVIFYRPSDLFEQDPEKTTVLYAIGSRFMVTALLLSLAVYGEQLIVNKFGGPEDGANYFTHATYFLFPISVFNGYFAFSITPWVRDNPVRYINTLREKKVLLVMAAVAYSAAVNGVGFLGWMLVKPMQGPPDLLLQGLFFLMCIAKTLYMLPGAYIGVFGRPRQHDLLIVLQVGSLVLAVLVLIVIKYLGWLGFVYAVALASASNWCLRTAVGFYVTTLITRSMRVT